MNKRCGLMVISLLIAVAMAACGTPAATDPATMPAQPSSTPASTPSSVPLAEPPQPESAPQLAPDDGCSSLPEQPTVIDTAQKDGTQLDMIYCYDPAQYTYHYVRMPETDYAALAAELAEYKPKADAVADKSAAVQTGFLAIMGDGTKYEYWMTADQLLNKEMIALELPDARRKELYDLGKASNVDAAAFPQWLIYMNERRITEVSFTGNDPSAKTPLDFKTTDKQQMVEIAKALQDFSVNRKVDTIKTAGQTPPATAPDMWNFKLTFDSGGSYDVYYDRSLMTVISSDMDYTLTYNALINNNIIQTVQRVSSAVTGQPSLVRENPATGKPVIYLYPPKTTEVSVKLDFKGELFYTFPTYNNGWQVTANPDGRLVNKSDKSEHYYLFWDGTSDTDWEFDSGFCVAGGDTEAFLKEKLSLLGLTPREYNDFITFWVPRLKSSPYNLITFAGQQYEELAKLTVTPTPESILRVHMVYKPLAKRQDIPEQILIPGFNRVGFTLVEWGGSLAK